MDQQISDRFKYLPSYKIYVYKRTRYRYICRQISKSFKYPVDIKPNTNIYNFNGSNTDMLIFGPFAILPIEAIKNLANSICYGTKLDFYTQFCFKWLLLVLSYYEITSHKCMVSWCRPLVIYITNPTCIYEGFYSEILLLQIKEPLAQTLLQLLNNSVLCLQMSYSGIMHKLIDHSNNIRDIRSSQGQVNQLIHQSLLMTNNIKSIIFICLQSMIRLNGSLTRFAPQHIKVLKDIQNTFTLA